MKRFVVLLMFLIAVPVCAIEVGVLDRPAGLYAVLADTDPLLAILTYSPLSSPVIYLARMGGFGGQGTVGVEGLVAGVATASSGSAGALGGYGLITSNGLVLAARPLSGQGGSAVAGTLAASGTHVVLLNLGGQGGTGTMGTLAITAGSSSSVARALVGLGASGGVFGSSDLLTSFDIPLDGLGGVADVGTLAAVGGSASLGAVLGGSGATGGYGVLTVSTTGNGITAALGGGASGGYGVITASGLVFGAASPDGQGSAGSTGTVGAAIGVVNGFAALGGTGATSSYGTITGTGFGLGAASLSGKGGAGSVGTVSSTAIHLVNAILTGSGAAGGYGVVSVAGTTISDTGLAGWTLTNSGNFASADTETYENADLSGGNPLPYYFTNHAGIVDPSIGVFWIEMSKSITIRTGGTISATLGTSSDQGAAASNFSGYLSINGVNVLTWSGAADSGVTKSVSSSSYAGAKTVVIHAQYDTGYNTHAEITSVSIPK